VKAILIEFRDFAVKGSIIDLAIAFVLGVAFAAVVSSVVEWLVMPLISMFVGEPNFRTLDFTINDAIFGYGNVLTEIVTFVAIAAVLFFAVVKPVKLLQERKKQEEAVAAPEPELSAEAKQFIEELTNALRRLETR
jgi:large conductance mechanosensitive channel